jgi:hypothetical protein
MYKVFGLVFSQLAFDLAITITFLVLLAKLTREYGQKSSQTELLRAFV